MEIKLGQTVKIVAGPIIAGRGGFGDTGEVMKIFGNMVRVKLYGAGDVLLFSSEVEGVPFHEARCF